MALRPPHFMVFPVSSGPINLDYTGRFPQTSPPDSHAPPTHDVVQGLKTAAVHLLERFNTEHHGNRIPLAGVFLAKMRYPSNSPKKQRRAIYEPSARFFGGRAQRLTRSNSTRSLSILDVSKKPFSLIPTALHNPHLIRLVQKPVTGYMVLYLARQKSTITPIAEDTSPASSAGPAPPPPPHTPHKVNFDQSTATPGLIPLEEFIARLVQASRVQSPPFLQRLSISTACGQSFPRWRKGFPAHAIEYFLQRSSLLQTASRITFANAVAISLNDAHVLIASTMLCEVPFYARDTATQALSLRVRVPTPFAPDKRCVLVAIAANGMGARAPAFRRSSRRF
ncbi:hypothetical protein BC826DRAFT_1106002 [Russula brevipes]|nr:hypothetical protein BC826DRAFT_1106002 [Russula brevipes]